MMHGLGNFVGTKPDLELLLPASVHWYDTNYRDRHDDVRLARVGSGPYISGHKASAASALFKLNVQAY